MKTLHPELHEHRQSLWLLVAAPALWAAHFLASYLVVAIWCEKVVGRDGSLAGARMIVAVATMLALAGIVVAGWRGWRRYRFGGAGGTLEFDTPADRRRFLGFATLLLAGLSAIATIFTALAVAFFHDCR